MKENLHFKQLPLNYTNNPQKQKKEHIKLVVVSTGVDVVAKIDDEVYVLSNIKIECHCFFGTTKKVELLKIMKVM